MGRTSHGKRSKGKVSVQKPSSYNAPLSRKPEVSPDGDKSRTGHMTLEDYEEDLKDKSEKYKVHDQWRYAHEIYDNYRYNPNAKELGGGTLIDAHANFESAESVPVRTRRLIDEETNYQTRDVLWGGSMFMLCFMVFDVVHRRFQ